MSTLYDPTGQAYDIPDDKLEKVRAKHPEFSDKPPQAQQATAPKPQEGALSRFGSGAGQGVNPFHQTPEGMAPDPLRKTSSGEPSGAVSQGLAKGFEVGEDFFNLREIVAKYKAGDKAGAAGMAAGTIAQNAMGGALAKGGKALKEAALAARAERELKAGAKAAPAARNIAKELGGGLDKALEVEKHMAPLRQYLDQMFQPVHNALQGGAVPFSNTIMQKAKLMQKSGEPIIRDIGEEVASRTAMGYDEARKFIQDIHGMMGEVSSRAQTHLDEIAHELDTGIDALAQSKGVGAERKAAKAATAEVNELARKAMSDTKVKEVFVHPSASAGLGNLGNMAVEGVNAAASMGKRNAMVISDTTKASTLKIAKKYGMPLTEAIGKASKGEKAGKVVTRAGQAVKAAPLTRALGSAIQPSDSAPPPQ